MAEGATRRRRPIDTQESNWEHPLYGYSKGLYERHKLAPAGSGPDAVLAAQMAQEQRLGHMQSTAGHDGRPPMRYGGSSSTSVLLQHGNRNASEDHSPGLQPAKGATAHALGQAPGGGGRVDMSLVERMEAERARATTEGHGTRDRCPSPVHARAPPHAGHRRQMHLDRFLMIALRFDRQSCRTL